MIGEVVRAIAVVLVFALAVVASVCAGAEEDLPEVALDWEPLFHVLRGGALLGAAGVILLVGWRATEGEFPIKFGNVEYVAKDAAAEAEGTAALQDRRIQRLELLAGVRRRMDLDDDLKRP